MIIEKTVSTKMFNVKPNGSIQTRQPSYVSMEIDHYLAAEASTLFMDRQRNQPHSGQLQGFRLVAIYDDGKEEPEIPVTLGGASEDGGAPEEM